MQWGLISDIILATSLVVFAVFAILGLYQWISRKSFKKIDRELTLSLIPFALMAATYVIFDKLIILNTRPNGSGEPSFPSSHVMVVTTIFLIVALILPKYIKSKPIYIAFDIVMFIMIILVCLGRVFANMHWASDVIGGVIFAIIFSVIYYLTSTRSKNAKRIHKNH